MGGHGVEEAVEEGLGFAVLEGSGGAEHGLGALVHEGLGQACAVAGLGGPGAASVEHDESGREPVGEHVLQVNVAFAQDDARRGMVEVIMFAVAREEEEVGSFFEARDDCSPACRLSLEGGDT